LKAISLSKLLKTTIIRYRLQKLNKRILKTFWNKRERQYDRYSNFFNKDI